MNIQSAKERLLEIVNLSYKIFQAKVVNGTIGDFENEASMQLQLGVIMNEVGLLYEWAIDDEFTIRFEKKLNLPSATSKTPNGHARCDIYVGFKTRKDEYHIGIELKYLPKSKDEATTDNRLAILEDIQNLEHYQQIGYIDTGFEIVYTTNHNYANSDTISCINIGDKAKVKEGKSSYKKVELAKEYTFLWDDYPIGEERHCFLKVKI
jgi:hypothetical protein